MSWLVKAINFRLSNNNLEKYKTNLLRERIFMNNLPLAARLRPKNLDEFVGQEHLVGPNKAIRKLIENNTLHAMVLWGPPGVGKNNFGATICRIN